MKDINRRIANLSPDQRALLELKIREKNLDIRIAQTIPRRRDIGPLPLSFGQQRLWFLDQLEQDSSFYNIPSFFRLTGALDVPVLHRSLNAIVSRHEILRTTFDSIDGSPMQVIARNCLVKLPVIDLSKWSDTARKAEVQRLLKKEAQSPFNLSYDLMLRAILLRFDRKEHLLLLVMHHIASDGWSMGVFFRELTALYETFSSSKPSPLPELSIQYADFAVWQRQWLQGEELEKQLSYWKKKLANLPPALELPTDYSRPSIQTYRGAHQSMVISKPITKKLQSLSCQEGVTMFMTLLAAFKTLLYRYTSQEDIVVGSPIANRNRREIEPLIGFFVNTLVLRTTLSGNPRFNKLLKRVRKLCLDAYTYQELPFEKLVEELQPERDLNRTPIFQVWFNMVNLGNNQFELPGLTIEKLPILEIPSKFDLSLYVREQNKEIHFKLVYNPDLFESDRMTEMLKQLKHLLTQIVEKPEERIDNFSLVTYAAQLILPKPVSVIGSSWNGSVQTLFSQQARRVPNHLAILDKQEIWTYKKLDTCSNQLANYLLARGIQPQNIIAIYGYRSSSLVWAILGVLKAGASFVILDPAYPASYHIAQLHVAKPSGCIHLEAAGVIPDTLEMFVKSLSCCCWIEIPQCSTSNKCEPWKGYSPDNPEVTINSDHLAYLIFTSGSTGKPKGILGGHGPLSHFLQWHIKTFDLKETDRFAMLSGISHDPLLRDIFTPLSMGATLCVPNPEDIVPGRLSEWMKKEEVSITHLTPTMGQILAEKPQDLICTSLRYVFFGGDKLTKYDVYRIQKLSPSVTCVNLYGATETPQAVGYFKIHNREEMIQGDNPARIKQNIPIGQGIKDVQLLVLNNSQQLCGFGETGEIYVRSPHLAKGYIDDDALTQKQFIINPFTKTPYDRLYKTGDLGQYSLDGNIEFFGRIDHQVKVRGFRIELGEIEANLAKHPGVNQVVVTAREGEPGNKRLVAYIVPEEDSKPSTNELRDFLKKKLPEYMIPSVFMMLESLPLMPNGKVDRKALPAPDQQRPDLDKEFMAPSTPTEIKLAEIWGRLLNLKEVGVNDNFFDLGGHSLLAVQLFMHIEKVFGKKIPLANIFKAQTIEQFARIIHQKGGSTPESSLVALQPNGSKPPFFCVHTVGGNIFRYQSLARHLTPDQPVYGIQAQRFNGEYSPHTSVKDMATHYIKEIRSLQPEGPYFLGGFCIGGIIAFEMAQQIHAQGQKVALLALFETYGPEYRKISPNAGLIPYKIYHRAYDFIQRFDYHLNILRLHNTHEKKTYILERVQNLKKKITKNLTGWARLDVQESNELIPQDLQKVEKSILQAVQDYKPITYMGSITLFQARNKPSEWIHDPYLGWEKLAAGGIVTLDIPGWHTFILMEPGVRVLAKKLRKCLHIAQTNA